MTDRRLDDDLDEIARSLPAVPRSYSRLRQLLALLPNPIAAGTQPSVPVEDMQQPDSAAAQVGASGGIGSQPGSTLMDGSIGTKQIRAGAITGPTFASTIRPVYLVNGLPTLPDAAYPVDSFVYEIGSTPHTLWKNVANVWTRLVGAGDIQADSITAGQIAAGAIGTAELSAGNITLFGPSGETILDPLGFGPVWVRGIYGMLFNSDFYAGPATLAANINNSTNPLPRWSLVKSSGTAIDGQVLADAGNGSGNVFRFIMASGAAGDTTYIEQIIPVLASQNRSFSYSPYGHLEWIARSGAGVSEFVVEIQFLKKDLTTTGSAQTAVYGDQPAANTQEIGISGNTAPPADAYYARLRFSFRRKAGAPTTATATVQINETFVIVGYPRLHVGEVNNPATYTRGSIFQFDGRLVLSPDSLSTVKAYLGISNANGVIDMAGFLSLGGTSFPTGPSDGYLYYRTDVGMWFEYDSGLGSWLCTCPHSTQVGVSDAVTPVTVSGYMRGIAPFVTSPITNIRLEVARTWWYIAGGSALSGSHKWVGVLKCAPSSTTHDTINIDSGPSDAHQARTANINAWMGSTNYVFEVNWTKTGTPGGLYAQTFVSWRYAI